MKEKKRIKIDGKHWEGIIKLPCFRALKNVEVLYLLVAADYVDGEKLGYEDRYYYTRADIGDELVEYDNGEWEVKYANKH